MAATKEEKTGGGGGSFSEERLTEKLDKLNSSAASIQTLSNWCIFHRKRAKRIVDAWEKQFNNATKDKKISFLYLSNDILQNSKRKGVEFMNEFWRVLPDLVKDFYENGGEDGKKVVARLIGIWDERKVFGTRSESLKYIVGDNPPTMNSNPVSNPLSNSKTSRKEPNTIIKKLTVGGMPEKIVTAYQYVLDQHFNEDAALNKCKTTMSAFEKMKRDVDAACTNDMQQVSLLISTIQEKETILKQCIEQLESVDIARISLINQLKEALNEQETKSELLRNQLQVARAEAEHVMQLKQRLSVHATNGPGSGSSTLMTLPSGQTAAMMQNAAIGPISPQFQPLHPTSLPNTASAAGDEPKKTAAAMADKLASLSSPEYVLSSVLASLAAEQAASMNGGSRSGELSEGPPGFQMQKRSRIENATQTSDMGASGFFGQLPQLQQQIGAAPTSVGGTQPSMQANQSPGSFAPPPPPLPPALPPLMQQFSQIAGGMVGMGPFGMMPGSVPPPPPPPLPNMLPPGFPRPSGPPPQPPLPPAQNQSHPQQQSPTQASQQSPTSTMFFPTPGTGFFPPVQVQQSPSVQRQ